MKYYGGCNAYWMTVKCPESIISSMPFLLKENTVQSTRISTYKGLALGNQINLNECMFFKVSFTSENVYDPLIWQFLQTQHKWHSKGGGKQWEGSDLGTGKKEVHCGEFKVIIKVEKQIGLLLLSPRTCHSKWCHWSNSCPFCSSIPAPNLVCHCQEWLSLRLHN